MSLDHFEDLFSMQERSPLFASIDDPANFSLEGSINSDLDVSNLPLEDNKETLLEVPAEKEQSTTRESKQKVPRTRKKRLDEATRQKRKTERARKNRLLARESRERKRKYVEALEREVTMLRGQVEFYRNQLSRYELVERHKNVFDKLS